jgi:hypothetical protein
MATGIEGNGTAHLDGNVLAGLLSELFLVDVTAASGRCHSCGDIAELARAMVYVDPTGYVVRCSNCDDVLMVIVEEPDSICLDLQGISLLRVPR